MPEFYYHRLRLDEKLPKKERIQKGIQSLEKNGLMSHSTLGRKKESSYISGYVPIFPNQYRIWFQDAIRGDFEDYSECLKSGACIVIRVNADQFQFKDDDQYFTGKSGDVVFASEDCGAYNWFEDDPECQWSIEPEDFKIRVPGSKEWRQLSNKNFKFIPSENLEDRVAPTIPIEMRHHGFNPNNMDDYAKYMAYDECYGAWTEWNGKIQVPKKLSEVIIDIEVSLDDLLENGINHYCI